MSTIKKQYAKIINDQTKELQIGVGCNVAYYLEIGMEYMETEFAYNGKWYLKGYAPKEPQPKPQPSPQTGDVKIKIAIGVFVIAALILVIVFVVDKKNKNKDK